MNITERVVESPQPAKAITVPGEPAADGTIEMISFRPPLEPEADADEELEDDELEEPPPLGAGDETGAT